MEPTDEKDAFEIIEARVQKTNPLPKLAKKTDGFSRTDVVNAFQHAFEMIGGVQRMALWADQNPDKFYPLYSKLLPSTAINIGSAAQVQIVHALAPTALDNHDNENQQVQDSPVFSGVPRQEQAVVDVGGPSPSGEDSSRHQ